MWMKSYGVRIKPLRQNLQSTLSKWTPLHDGHLPQMDTVEFFFGLLLVDCLQD